MADKKGSILKDSAVGTFLVGFAVVVVGFVVVAVSVTASKRDESPPADTTIRPRTSSAARTRTLHLQVKTRMMRTTLHSTRASSGA